MVDHNDEGFVYENVTLHDIQVAALVWPILLDLARHKHALTYGELVWRIKEENPDNEMAQTSIIPVGIGRKLDTIRRFTNERDYPDVTALIISKGTGEVGKSFIGDAAKIRQAINAFDWSEVTDEFDLYIEASAKAITPKKKRGRDEARKLMASYYRDNKNNLPANIVEYRETILAELMNGEPPEDAFKN